MFFTNIKVFHGYKNYKTSTRVVLLVKKFHANVHVKFAKAAAIRTMITRPRIEAHMGIWRKVVTMMVRMATKIKTEKATNLAITLSKEMMGKVATKASREIVNKKTKTKMHPLLNRKEKLESPILISS